MRPIQEIVGAALRDRLLEADAAVQRNVALCAASAAARDVALVDPVVDEAFEDLLLERYSPGMRAAVEAIEEHLDEIAWSRQELVDRGEAERSEYEIAFRRARAAAAVKMCLDATASAAMSEAVYEAGHAVPLDDRLPHALETVIELIAPGNGWAARTVAELFWPDFVDIEGFVLLASHYSPDNLAQWRERRPDSLSAIEDVINHVHLEDIAHDRAGADALRTAGDRIAAAWRRTIETQLPGRAVTVVLDGTVLTAFTPSG